MSGTTSPAAGERARLADALAAAGPEAPTLCAGWTARDLAAHLAARERRPDSLPGLALAPLAGWTERVRARYAGRPYDELVRLVRTGPPRTPPFGLPGVDRAVNLTEHFVHAEDVLRGRHGAAAATLPGPAVREALWAFLGARGRALLRRAPVPLVLVIPDGRELRAGRAGDDGEAVRLVGEPGELVLVAFGRGAHAAVRREGSDAALAALAGADLRV